MMRLRSLLLYATAAAGACLAPLAFAQAPAAKAAPADEEEQGHKIPRDLQVQDHIIYNHSLAADGSPVSLLFIKPLKQVYPQAPLVIFIHGGGWSKGAKTSVFKGTAAASLRRLSNAGCAIASVEYRLATEGKSTMMDCATDCFDAMRFFVKEAARFGIDPQRVALWGESAGAHLVLVMGLGKNEDFPGDPALKDFKPSVKCAAAYYAPTSFVNPAINGRWRESSDRLFGGPPEQKADLIAKLSPAEYIHPGAPAIFLAQGLEDTLVLPEHSRYFKRKAEEKGVPVELLEVKGARHGFKGNAIEPSIEVIHERTADFFLRNLTGESTPTAKN